MPEVYFYFSKLLLPFILTLTIQRVVFYIPDAEFFDHNRYFVQQVIALEINVFVKSYILKVLFFQ